MHEEVLFRDLREKLVDLATTEKASSISRVTIWLGALSHVTETRLREAWPGIVRGSAAEGSVLAVTTSGEIDHPRAGSVVVESVAVRAEGAPT